MSANRSWTRENRLSANRRLLESLTALWDTVPDQRFGQLLMNLARTEGGFEDTWEWTHAQWRTRIDEAYNEWQASA